MIEDIFPPQTTREIADNLFTREREFTNYIIYSCNKTNYFFEKNNSNYFTLLDTYEAKQ